MFFNVLTAVNGGADLRIDDFVSRCSRMKGTASGIDLHSLAYQVQLMHAQIGRLTEHFMGRPDRHRRCAEIASRTPATAAVAQRVEVEDILGNEKP